VVLMQLMAQSREARAAMTPEEVQAQTPILNLLSCQLDALLTEGLAEDAQSNAPACYLVWLRRVAASLTQVPACPYCQGFPRAFSLPASFLFCTCARVCVRARGRCRGRQAAICATRAKTSSYNSAPPTRSPTPATGPGTVGRGSAPARARSTAR
jgi:hypothetical protein